MPGFRRTRIFPGVSCHPPVTEHPREAYCLGRFRFFFVLGFSLFSSLPPDKAFSPAKGFTFSPQSHSTEVPNSKSVTSYCRPHLGQTIAMSRTSQPFIGRLADLLFPGETDAGEGLEFPALFGVHMPLPRIGRRAIEESRVEEAAVPPVK